MDLASEVPAGEGAGQFRSPGEAAELTGPYPRFTDVFGSVREARNTIGSLGLRPDLQDKAALVVTELATNAVLHAGGLLSVRIWYGHDCLRLEVADGSDVLPEPGAPGNMSGRGLQIVSALAQAWGSQSRSGGKVVWAELS